MKKSDLIIVRGAGDLATGTIHRLKKAIVICWFWKQITRRRSEDRWRLVKLYTVEAPVWRM